MDKTNTNDTMWKGAPSGIFTNAIALRERMTPEEVLLWEELKRRKFLGLKFRRQHPIMVYVADFYCHSLKLIIEIDGGYHLTVTQRAKDKERTKNLEFNGIKVVRFTNEMINTNMPKVLVNLESICKEIRE